MTGQEYAKFHPQPTHEDIEKVAHQLWIQHGEMGNEKEHWKTAELTLWVAYVHQLDKLVTSNGVLR